MLSANNEIRAFIRQIENTLHNSRESSELQATFSDVENIVLSDREISLKTTSFSNFTDARTCLFQNFYMQLLKTLLNNISPDIACCLQVQTLNQVLAVIFRNGNLKHCFLTLSWGISEFRYFL